jgi:nitrate/nitrite-specific signal transduction histidine kinase
MRERAVMVGADLRVANRPEGGVEVRLEVPLGDEAAWYR